jgi:dolichyl-phosphate-mannose--protein O-mannosyl transferase
MTSNKNNSNIVQLEIEREKTKQLELIKEIKKIELEIMSNKKSLDSFETSSESYESSDSDENIDNFSVSSVSLEDTNYEEIDIIMPKVKL